MPALLVNVRDYVDQPISNICTNNYSSPSDNHCAHFVSHALDIQLGMLCGDMKFETKGTGASIRCNELFNLLTIRGTWDERPTPEQGMLIFVTSARNVRGSFMGDNPHKHVGIYQAGMVLNYSNTHHKVVLDPNVEAFHNKFKHTYPGGDISLYYGIPQ